MSKIKEKPIKESNIIDKSKWADFTNIQVFINQKKILENINTSFQYGDNVVILGPNGSGKTTFLKLINRSIYPKVSKDSSFKLFSKENINVWEIRKKIGFLFKEMEERVNKGVKTFDLILSGFTGLYNARKSNLLTTTERESIKNIIIELGLSTVVNQEFDSLSDGQKRITLLARALVYKPKIIVLDEPFSNLDIKSSFILNQNLNRLIEHSINILYVTHNLESILPKTNRVILIKEGKIIKEGNPNEIINSKTISDLFKISINVVKQDGYWRTYPVGI